MTRNLKLLTLFGLIWSVGFFGILNWCLQAPEHRGPIIFVSAVTYGIGYGLAGWYLGKRDPNHKTRLNLSFWYSIVGQLTSLFVGTLWIVFFRHDELDTLIWMLVIFGTIIGLTYLGMRKSVKGMSREELFK